MAKPPGPVTLHLASAPRATGSDGRDVPLAPLDAALLAWLALEGPTPRARLAGLLWPDRTADAARNSLRQRLFQLHKRIGVELVQGGLSLALAEGVMHDLDEADSVLDGVELALDAEFAAWLERQRARRHERLRGSLVQLAEMAERGGDWDDALAHARELLALDPLAEDAHRRVIRLHYLRGDRAAALLAFDACERLLKDEIGARPSAETIALLTALQQADQAVVPRRAVPPATLLRPPRLIGRDAAWNALVDAGEAHQVALVEGEAGMGKSRLVADFAARAPQSSLTVGARPGDTSVPYACAARLVRSLVQRVGEPPAVQRRTLSRLLPEWGEPLDSDDAWETARLHAAIAALLARAADAGVSLVVLDDLHFADPGSVETLAALATEHTTQRWVLTTRPAEGSSAARSATARLLESGRARRVVLAPLGPAEIAELVDSLAVPGWSGAALAPRLAQHSGGNPLFLLETLKSMPVGTDATGRLPTVVSVSDLIGRRIRRLSPEAVRIARCAALAGEDFSAELAARLLRAGPLDLADAWAELEAAHVLHDQSFAHDLIRDAARASVPAPLARQLHAQIAQYLTEQSGAPQRIAAHWRASPHPERAVPHLLRAGRDAIKALRRQEGAQFLLEAAELLERAGERAAAFDAVGEYFGRRAPADALHEQMLERLGQLAETPLQRALVGERIAGRLTNRGEFARAGEAAEAALALFRHEMAPALASALLVKSWGAQLQRGDIAQAVHTASRAVALAETSDDDEAKQNAVSALGAALTWAGRYGEAEPHKVRALELAKRLGKPLVIIDATLELVAQYRGMGRMDQARVELERAEQLACSHDIDLEAHWPWYRLEQARATVAQGDYRLAVQSVEAATHRLAQAMPHWRIAADNLATTIWMTLGQWARARRSAQDALAGCDDAPPLYAAQARCLALQVDLAIGAVPDALGRADAALARLGGGSPRAAQQLLLLRSTLVEPREAIAIACRVRDEARRDGLFGVALDAELHAGAAARRAADAARAATHARDALALFAQVEPAGGYRAQVWLEAATALEGVDADEARRVIRQATRWVREVAERQVPAEFRDGFLQRNPVNRALMALAARQAH